MKSVSNTGKHYSEIKYFYHAITNIFSIPIENKPKIKHYKTLGKQPCSKQRYEH